MPLKILSWNIQTFGVKRQVPDRLSQVARVLADEKADIVCIQELVVSRYTHAATVVANLNRYLPDTLQYNYILCPTNRFEMYLYLYRGSAALQALTLRQNGPVMVDTNTASTVVRTPHQANTQIGGGAAGLDHYFPLFYYLDLGGARAPGLGLFRYTDPHRVTRDLCVMNWHNDARGHRFLRANINLLARTPIIDARAFPIATTTGASNVANIVVAGDFNNALQPNPFAGYTVHIAEKTHLHAFNRHHDGQYPSSDALRDASYDNLVTALSGLAAGDVRVIDLPRRLWDERNGLTKRALLSSELLAPGAQDEAEEKKRLLASFPSQKEDPADGISKTTRAMFRHFLNGVNLRRIRSNTLRPMIDARLGDLSGNVREILTRRTLDFVEHELNATFRWSRRQYDMNGLRFNEALYLTHKWMSDHLPLVMTLTP